MNLKAMKTILKLVSFIFESSIINPTFDVWNLMKQKISLYKPGGH